MDANIWLLVPEFGFSGLSKIKIVPSKVMRLFCVDLNRLWH